MLTSCMKQEKDSGYSSQFKRAVTSLPVKPQNTAGGKVILDIQVKKDSLDHDIDQSLSRKKLG